MKTTIPSLLILTIAAAVLTLTGCEEKGPAAKAGGKVGEKIDDALDQRPAEGVRDAIEKHTK